MAIQGISGFTLPKCTKMGFFMPFPTRTVYSPELQRASSVLNKLCLEEFAIAATLHPESSPPLISELRAEWMAGTARGRASIGDALPYALIDLQHFVDSALDPSAELGSTAHLSHRVPTTALFPWSRPTLLIEALQALLWHGSHAPTVHASMAMGLSVTSLRHVCQLDWHAQSRLKLVAFPAPRWGSQLAFWKKISQGCAEASPPLLAECARWGVQFAGTGQSPRQLSSTNPGK
jgi:hypothetical protein